MTFETHRDRLRAIAQRILGSASEADDAVQETWLRFSRTDTSDVANLAAWLNTVVSRVCLNMLQARSIRPQPVDDPAPVDFEEETPEELALIGDAVGLALLVVLDTLGPAERVAFVLHDVFGIPFDEIAPIVDRSPVATRQLASRARARVRRQESDPEADRVRQAALVDAFLAAAHNGDFEALVAALDPDVVLRADERAVQIGAAPETRGAQPVGTFMRRAVGATPAFIDGRPGAVWLRDGELAVVYTFATGPGGITAIDLIADPARHAQLEIVVT